MSQKHDESWNRNDNVEKFFTFNLQIAIIYVAIILCPQKFMLNLKILILCSELREMSIHISLCLKFQSFKYQKKYDTNNVTYFIALYNESRW